MGGRGRGVMEWEEGGSGGGLWSGGIGEWVC